MRPAEVVLEGRPGRASGRASRGRTARSAGPGRPSPGGARSRPRLSRSPAWSSRSAQREPEARADGDLAGRRGRTAPRPRPSTRVATRSRLAHAAHRTEQDRRTRRCRAGRRRRSSGPRPRAAAPTSARSRSPAAWPRLSLTTLNRSRSSRDQGRPASGSSGRPTGPAASRCSARRLSSRVRLGRPVSMSWRAAWARWRTSVWARSKRRALSSAIDASWANRTSASNSRSPNGRPVARREPDHAEDLAVRRSGTAPRCRTTGVEAAGAVLG